jgi:hypothetical protein
MIYEMAEGREEDVSRICFNKHVDASVQIGNALKQCTITSIKLAVLLYSKLCRANRAFQVCCYR